MLFFAKFKVLSTFCDSNPIKYPKPRLKALVTNNQSKCICQSDTDRHEKSLPGVEATHRARSLTGKNFAWVRLGQCGCCFILFLNCVLIHKCIIINVEPILCSYSWDASNYLRRSVALKAFFLQKHSCHWLCHVIKCQAGGCCFLADCYRDTNFHSPLLVLYNWALFIHAHHLLQRAAATIIRCSGRSIYMSLPKAYKALSTNCYVLLTPPFAPPCPLTMGCSIISLYREAPLGVSKD